MEPHGEASGAPIDHAISPAALRDLAKARSHTALAASAPWLETEGTNRPHEVAALIDDAIERIDDDQRRAAARALFPLPYSDAAPSLSERRKRAADVYFVSANTFRSGSANHPSREDLVLAELGRQLVPAMTEAGSTTTRGTAAPGSRRRTARLTGAVAAVVLIVSAVMLLDGDGEGNRVAASEEAAAIDERVPATFVGDDPSESGGDTAGPRVTGTPPTDQAADARPLPGSRPGSVAYVPGRSATPVTIVVTPDEAPTIASEPTPAGASTSSGRRSTGEQDDAATPNPGAAAPDPATSPSTSRGASTSARPGVPTPPSGSALPPGPGAPEVPALPPGSASDETPAQASPDQASVTDDQPPVGPEDTTTSTTEPGSTTSTSTTSSTTSTTSTSTTSTSTTSTSTTTTSSLPPADRSCPGSDVTVDPYRLRRVEALVAGLGRSGAVCQATRPQTFQNLDVVKFRVFDDDTTWVDVIFDDGSSLVVPDAAWSGYDKLVELAATQPHIGDPGVPAQWRPLAGGGSELLTTTGIVLSGGHPSILHFRVTEPFLDAWLADRARLGEPMRSSRPNAAEFEHGRMDLTDGVIGTTYWSFEDVRRTLPPDEQLANSIIRQPAATAWWVDDQLRRWWIPDGGTYACLGGDGARSANNLEGAVVATLPLAGRAYCGLAGG